MERLTRRRFFTIAGAGLFYGCEPSGKVFRRFTDSEDDMLDDQGYREGSAHEIEEIEELEPLTVLQEYLWDIEQERYEIEQQIISYPGNDQEGYMLRGIKRLTKQRELEEFNRYFPMYRATEIKYCVPWSLLMILHAHETTFSSDPATYNNFHHGAMQRAFRSWPESQTLEAGKEWEFLAELPQRYPNDWREIMWAGYHINRLSQRNYPNQTQEEGSLLVVRYNYSAEHNATIRVEKYRQLRASLQIIP